MKIICSKADLAKGVGIVSRAVPSKTTMSILECILIDASADSIKLVANDMELGIDTVIPGRINEKGIIAIEAKVFSEIVRKLPENDVVIETDDSCRMIITCEKAKFNIAGRAGDDFAYLPYVEKKDRITLSEFTLKEAVRQTIFSVGDSEGNRMMTGELFEVNENRMRVASLDGHRISIRYIDLRENYGNVKVIVPGKALMEVSRILPGEVDDMVDIYFTSNHILFEFGATRVVSRLIEGEFFHIDQMLSNDYGTKIKVNRKDFTDCMERALLLVREGDKKPVVFNIEEDYMEMKINSMVGSMDEEMEIEKEGRDMMIGFNPKFMIDVLRAVDDEEITMYMVNSKAPCFIKDDDGSYIYLVLPVNFNAANF